MQNYDFCVLTMLLYSQNTKYIIAKFLCSSQTQSSLSATHTMHTLQVLQSEYKGIYLFWLKSKDVLEGSNDEKSSWKQISLLYLEITRMH